METAGPITYRESIKEAKKNLADAIDNKWNVLTSLDSLINIPPDHKVTIEKIEFSPDLENREVYLQEGKKEDDNEKKRYAIAKNGLLRIAQDGGVQIDHSNSGRIDDMRSKDYIAWRVVGAAQRLDGSWFPLQASYDIDYEIIWEEILEGKRRSASYWKKEWWKKKSDDEKNAQIKKIARSDFLRFKRHGMSRCETGALLRLIRGCFPLMKGVYKHEEIIKPFVVARLVYQPNQNDPIIRAQMATAFLSSMRGVYGAPTPQIPHVPAHIVDMERNTNGSYEPKPTDPEPEPDHPSSEPEPENGDDDPTEKEVFSGLGKEEQIRLLKTMAERKGYVLKDLKFPVEQFTDVHRADFFKILNEMEDKIDDNIPF